MKILHISVSKQIVIALGFCTVLSFARPLLFGSGHLLFMFWNVFLAIIPFIVSSLLLNYSRTSYSKNLILIVGGIIWILFLPNAPYLVTDLIHVGKIRVVPALFDSILLFMFAWVGMLLYVHSVCHIEEIARKKFSGVHASVIVIFVTLLCGFGMYLGRFLRFNSWDIVSAPLNLFQSIFEIFADPQTNIDAYLFTGLFFLFCFVSYLAWKGDKR